MNIFLNIQFTVVILLVGWINAEDTPPPPSFTPDQCGAFLGLQFDIFKFDEYDTYFDATSSITLAQTGTYVGPSNMEEYVRFSSDSSPYVAMRRNYATDVVVTGFDPVTGICKFSIYSISGADLNPEFTSGDTVNFGAIVTLYYSIPKSKVGTIYVFYSTAFLEGFFSRLRTDETDDFICDTLLSPTCLNALGDNAEVGLTKQDCKRRLSETPLTEGEELFVDGNTYGCRALHTVFAAVNPTHCAHIAFAPTEDYNGKIKCQVSDGLSPSELFTQAEIDRFFQTCASSPEVDDNCFRVIPRNPPTKNSKKGKRAKMGKMG